MSPLVISQFTFRTFLAYLVAALVVAAFITYVLFQARFLIAGPQITVLSPSGEYENRHVIIEGNARNIVNITLNGRQIYTDKDGNFKEALVLENGYTIATLRAQDRYGRQTSHAETYVFAPKENDTEEMVIN